MAVEAVGWAGKNLPGPKVAVKRPGTEENHECREQIRHELEDAVSGPAQLPVSADTEGADCAEDKAIKCGSAEHADLVEILLEPVDLAGIRAARAAGLTPLKINCVLLRGFNDDQVEAFAHFARQENVVVRFIEFMPLEEDRLWSPEIVVPLKEIVSRISRVLPLVELPLREPSETARRYGFADGQGEIGIIAPVTNAFCGACSRVRLTSDGKIRTCLFSQVEHDLYGRMRAGESDAELRAYILRTVQGKEARHHIGEPGFLKPSRSMVHIGG